MQKCRICGGSDFYKEAGYYFCQTCQTQNEDIREEVLELRVDTTTRLRRTRIRKARSDLTGEEAGWTTWELYNFVLIGMTNELIELGVSSDIKLTVLQLWATYLGKIEVAFISSNKKSLPKLARRYNKRDAQIIYGKVKAQKRARKRRRTASSAGSMTSSFQSDGSSTRDLNKNKRLLATADYDRFIQSQASSEGDGLSLHSQSLYSIQSSNSGKSSGNEVRLQFSSHAREETRKIKKLSKNVPRGKRTKYKQTHVTTKYKTGPYVVTPMRLWAIIYLALRIHNEPLQLADMLRYGREGHLSYYKLDHLLPPEVTLTKSEVNFLSQQVALTHKGMRRIVASMAKFLNVWTLVCPDYLSLINRYCQELGLPRGIQLYAERLVALSPPQMKFDSKRPYIPNYEGRAIAFIIVVLKVLLGLDGVTEYHISDVAEKINSSRSEQCKCEEVGAPSIIVHGGAGNCDDSVIIEKITGCKTAASNGYKKLLNGRSAIEAVETALWWLECDEFFNCSYGSALNELGEVQMDASMMNGSTLECGSVAAVSDIEHPISLARYAMEHFPNSIFVGEGAKRLARIAKLSKVEKGNMVAPGAYAAFKSEAKSYEIESYTEVVPCTGASTNCFGTVGCVAFDGCVIAAGTTTGGPNRKLVGRVGDSPILGCGTYANKVAGCSLTGHGESILKLGLSRSIVEDISETVTAEESLRKNFAHMSNLYNQTGGGIVLQPNGTWSRYFTTDKMPFAAIEKGLITFGASLDESDTEQYKDQATDEPCHVATDRALVNAKLFSFREWQRYIECRKTILIHSHFPTKLKYSPNTPGIDGLYLKFLESINSKGDRDEPEITNRKNYLPEDLVQAMKKCMISFSDNDLPPKDMELFPPSLTPLHSYLHRLLNHPLHDLPTVVRTDFFLAKVGYMTRPDSLKELARQCDIDLKIIDTNLHFVEKMVPPFEQYRMPTVEELNAPVEVEDSNFETERCVEETTGSLNNYLHRKIPFKMRINNIKQYYYNTSRSVTKNYGGMKKSDDFSFNDILPDGRLAIPPHDDFKDDKKNEDTLPSIAQTSSLLNDEFCNKYNLCLSDVEKQSVRSPDKVNSIRARKETLLVRDAKGKFIKRTDARATVGMKKPVSETNSFLEFEDFMSDIDDLSILRMEDTDLLQLAAQIEENVDTNLSFSLNEYLGSSQISLFPEDNPLHTKKDEDTAKVQFFRPFRDYWMYHCIFSRVKPKNFEAFEKTLPRTFRWLLKECAYIVEMPTEDLYEEICLIEAYHANILRSSEKADNANVDSKAKRQCNIVLSKW